MCFSWTILLKNFNPKTTHEDLESFFGRIGKVRKTCFFAEKFSGFPKFIYVEFCTSDEKTLAKELNHALLKGNSIKIEEKRNIPASYEKSVKNFSFMNFTNKTSKVSKPKGYTPYWVNININVF